MNALERLAERLGAEVYLEIAGWHLYLRDVRTPPLARELATSLAPFLKTQQLPDLAQLLSGIPVPVGGGKGEVTLWQCLPAASVRALEELVAEYARGWPD
ncbi:MAG: DUF3181 family protein [Thermostichales cyanobacterium DRC_bins_46]